MLKRMAWVIRVGLILGIALAVAGCSFNTAKKKSTDAAPFKEGETLGKIERLPGGTAIASNVITLLNVSCVKGDLIVRTNMQIITGKMDCAQEIPQAALERFYGQAVTVGFASNRLRIDSISAGTIDLPVTSAMVTNLHASP